MKDRFYFYPSIPRRKIEIIEDRFGDGIDRARVALKTGVPIKAYFYLSQSKKKLTDGRLWHKGKMLVGISPRVLKSRTYLHRLSASAAHEYVHQLRDPKAAKTVLAAAVEEGVATYIETQLFEAPEYLDIKTLNEGMVRVCADKIRAALFDKPSNRRMIWSNEAYREMLYRLGFGIIRRYAKDHPKLSLAALARVPQQKYIRFAIAGGIIKP